MSVTFECVVTTFALGVVTGIGLTTFIFIRLIRPNK